MQTPRLDSRFSGQLDLTMATRPDLDTAVLRTLLDVSRRRFARDAALVLLGHLALIVLLFLLIQGEVRASALAWWFGVLVVTTIGRAAWMWRGRQTTLDDDALLRGARITAGLHALAWSLGAALLMPSLTTSDLAIVLLILAGIGAGSLATLASDAPSLYVFLAALSLPLPFGVLAAGTDRDHLVAAGVVLVFSPVMLTLYRRSHAVLREHTRATLELAASQREQAYLITELKETLARNRVLGGLLPICANCKKIRDDQGYWSNVERYVADHSDARFSHGMCPDCLPKLFPGVSLPPDEPAPAG